MKSRLFVPCFAVVALGLVSCGFGKTVTDFSSYDDPLSPSSPNHPINLCAPLLREQADTLALGYNSCSEIESDLKDVRDFDSCVSAEFKKIYDAHAAKNSTSSSPDSAAAKSSAVPTADSASSKADVLTNLREAGVDEADVVKVSATQIFVASSGNSIQVIERAGKKLIGTVTLPLQESSSSVALMTSSARRQNNLGDKPKMFVTAERLIVLKGNTVVTYKTASGQLPVFLQSTSLDGQLSEARLVGERLVVASTDQQDFSADRKTGRKEIICSSVMRPVSKIDLKSKAVTRLASISIHDLSDRVESIHPGYFSLYMTPKNVYLYGSGNSSWFHHSHESTSIRMVSLDSSGRMSQVVRGKVKGRIKDVWALSELPGGELAVASSTGDLWDGSARNHFGVFAKRDNRLGKIGETADYGAKEDIRSVRFVGKTAYVVTFKKTDPLYAIDVSTPAEPRILGELKIPGFSTYMHPLSAERLIGLGFDATDQGDFAYYQGLQVSLFDTRDPMNMSRKDVGILGVRGTASAAITDHKAFYMDQSEQMIGFPVSELNECHDSFACQKTPAAQQQLALGLPQFSGAVFYKISGDELGEEKRVTHTDLMSANCRQASLPTWNWWQDSQSSPDIQRVFKLAGEIVTISQGALKSFRMGADLEQTGSARWESDCD
jgi:uncharacterized secreted protein with C-terminal beta-propeller domain